MRMVGSRNCASPSGVDDPPRVPYAVASSPCATASRNLRTNASAGDDCAATGAAVGATVGAGVRAGVAVVVDTGAGVAVFATLAAAVGVGDGVAVGFEVTVAVAVAVDAGFDDVDGFADGAGVVVTATVAIGVGVCITTSGVRLCAGAGTCRAANAERSAPIPKPAMITPAKSGTIGKPPRSSSSLEERRRRGGPDPELMFSQRSTRGGLALDGRTHGEANPKAA